MQCGVSYKGPFFKNYSLTKKKPQKIEKWNKGSEASYVTGRWGIGYLTWTDWTANKVNGT